MNESLLNMVNIWGFSSTKVAFGVTDNWQWKVLKAMAFSLQTVMTGHFIFAS